RAGEGNAARVGRGRVAVGVLGRDRDAVLDTRCGRVGEPVHAEVVGRRRVDGEAGAGGGGEAAAAGVELVAAGVADREVVEGGGAVDGRPGGGAVPARRAGDVRAGEGVAARVGRVRVAVGVLGRDRDAVLDTRCGRVGEPVHAEVVGRRRVDGEAGAGG